MQIPNANSPVVQDRSKIPLNVSGRCHVTFKKKLESLIWIKEL